MNSQCLSLGGGWCGWCRLLLSWACTLAICCRSYVWTTKKASDPAGGGFGGFICGSELITGLLWWRRASRSTPPCVGVHHQGKYRKNQSKGKQLRVCPILSRFRRTVNIPLIPLMSHPDLMANPDASHMCARNKIHTYNDSVYRDECHNFIT
jgi:hypothetical protein